MRSRYIQRIETSLVREPVASEPALRPEDAVRIIRALIPDLGTLDKEHFGILCLNVRRRVVGWHEVSVGSLSTALAEPVEVFAPAVAAKASAIIVFHNHPSGEPNPSGADVALTERLVMAGKMLGIAVLDHFILASASYFSFKEAGMLHGGA